MCPKELIVVKGDAQARGIAMLFERLQAMTSAYDIVFVDSMNIGPSKSDLRRCAFLLEQFAGESLVRKLPRHCKRITFPKLRMNLLWPLAAPNPYNEPEPGNPLGPYPIGNSFIISGIEHGVPSGDIMRVLLAGAWSSTWPNLDALFKAETAALLAADAKCDIKVGSFVLKYFRRRRLFWSPNAPSNELLAELAYRISHACFGRETLADRAAIQDAFVGSRAARDMMSHIAVPVHPAVAAHFKLEWYEPGERYPSNVSDRSLAEYYEGMIEYIQARRTERLSAPVGRSDRA